MKKDILHEYAEDEPVRINRFLSDAGYCSRRQADNLVAAGRVTVDGIPALTGQKVARGQSVCVDGRQISRKESLILIALNKPQGIVCTSDRVREKNNIIDFLGLSERVYPIGRLDKNSRGLILLTNDGTIVNHILRARQYHEKEYVVTVREKITPSFLKGMAGGVALEEAVTRPCRVTGIDEHTFRIILTQGLNRQIRRMCAVFGYHVTDLLRVRIMGIRLGDLPEGQWRAVTRQEIDSLKRDFRGEGEHKRRTKADMPGRPGKGGRRGGQD